MALSRQLHPCRPLTDHLLLHLLSFAYLWAVRSLVRLTWILCHFIVSVFGSCPFLLILFKTLRRNEVETDQGGGLCPKKADDDATQCQAQERQEWKPKFANTLMSPFPWSFTQWSGWVGWGNYKKLIFVHNAISKYLIVMKPMFWTWNGDGKCRSCEVMEYNDIFLCRSSLGA